ncbi:MAG: YidC/Oxa1 family membrane protein insertase [Cognaticolwellia sp.]|jgi:YidC/Oxa1 family membrane protein insertase
MAIKKKDSSESTRMLIAMALVMGIFFAYQSFFAPPAPVVEPVAETLVVDPVQPVVPSIVPDISSVSAAEEVPERTLDLATPEIHAPISSHGGSPRQLELPNVPGPLKVTPIWLAAWESIQGDRIFRDWFSAPYGEDPGTEKITSENAVVLAAGTGAARAEGEYFLEGSGPWMATRTTPEGLRLTKTWAATENPNVLSVQVVWENISGAPVAAELWVGSYDVLSQPGGMMSRYESLRQAFGYVDGDLETLEDITDIDEDGPEAFEGDVGWFGVGDRYFLSVAVMDQPAWGTFAFAGSEADTHGAFVSSTKTIQPGQTEELNFQIFAGQRNIQTLSDLGSDLDQAVDLGFFGFFARWLLKYLIWIHSLVGNWGLAIILLTVSVKVLFLPLTKKSFESSQKMQALQPQVQELKAKYENDPQRAGQEQMKLFQKEGVNPMSGCLPMLIQMPVWFALFTVLLYTAELYHADFLIWKDLSVVDPFAILPAIVGTMMLLQQRMTPTSPGMDPNQARMMKLMPLIFVFFYFTFPAGLAIYSTTNITLSLLQMWVIRRRLAKPPTGAPATLAAK